MLDILKNCLWSKVLIKKLCAVTAKLTTGKQNIINSICPPPHILTREDTYSGKPNSLSKSDTKPKYITYG